MPDISLSSIRKIMRRAGIERASRDAIEELRDIIEEQALEIAKIALELAEHAKRKTVQREDIKMAAKLTLQRRTNA